MQKRKVRPATTRSTCVCSFCNHGLRPDNNVYEGMICNACGTRTYSPSVVLSSTFDMDIFLGCLSIGESYTKAYSASCGGEVPEDAMLFMAI